MRDQRIWEQHFAELTDEENKAQKRLMVHGAIWERRQAYMERELANLPSGASSEEVKLARREAMHRYSESTPFPEADLNALLDRFKVTVTEDEES